MKKAILLISLLLLNRLAFCQWFIDFESPDSLITIDTTAGNLWQIGSPNKTEFDSAFSGTKVIVTDTTDLCPENSISSFILKVPFSCPSNSDCGITLSFRYKLQSDTLKDGGIIEVSADHGQTWENQASVTWYYGPNSILSDTLLGGAIGLTGNRSAEWNTFASWNCNQWYGYDYLLFRFSFKTDSSYSLKEGWVIDDINVGILWCEGIEEINTNYHFSGVFPNPVTNISFLQIKNENQKIESIQIFNSLGVMVKTISHPHQNNFPILKKDFFSGMYLYRVQLANGKMDEGKFAVE